MIVIVVLQILIIKLIRIRRKHMRIVAGPPRPSRPPPRGLRVGSPGEAANDNKIIMIIMIMPIIILAYHYY